MIDTRAGFWLQLAIVVLTSWWSWSRASGPVRRTDLRSILSITVAPATVLLPIIGILLVSSEWSQRTALTTFTLVPRRTRVLAAKLLASVVLSLVALALCVVVAVVGTAVAAPGLDEHLVAARRAARPARRLIGDGHDLGRGAGRRAAGLGAGHRALLVLPIGWAIGSRLAGLDAVARWLDGTYSLAPLTEHLMSAMEWARAGTTLALWMALPLLIGLLADHTG